MVSFAADSDWTLTANVAISGGKLDFTNALANVEFAQQAIVAPIGKVYKITLDVSNLGSGESIKIRYPFQDTSINANGSHTVIGVGDTVNFFRITPNSSTATFSIDNVSIKEVISGFDTPRLEYPMIDGVVSGCPSLLLEPQRTNLVKYSEDFDNAVWTTSNVIKSSNSSISPSGNLNADLVYPSSSGSLRRILQSVTILNANTYTSTVFLKYSGIAWVFVDGVNGNSTWFNIQSGVIGTIGASNTAAIKDFGNGWFRCSVTATSTSTTGYSYLSFSDADNSTSVTANGTSGVYIWGAQLEEGSYPTSYIPTNGSAVTRLAEVCNSSGDASTFNDSEGVLMAEISALANDGTSRRIAISDGSYSNRIYLEFDEVSNKIFFNIISGGNSYFITYTSLDLTISSKIALKYKLNDIALWFNGIKVGENPIAIMPINLSELAFDDGGNTSKFYGKTKQIQYFQTALTDNELEELTSWDSFKVMAIAQLYNIE
jgi:hypothetical protein